jgi:exopolyphosphatase / guanosine-5'-triphosphate,3'-diphosphate pyrophosphatase
MLCGCIDIGTNTTRVLVADARDGRLTEVLQRRAFTRLGRGLTPGGAIPAARIAENAGVVAEQVALAEQAGAQSIRTVATACIRVAANREEFCAAMFEHGGVEVNVLDGEEEARLAFLGATKTLETPPAGRVAVVDVGGGSTEIAIGTVDGGVEWWRSFAFGSGFLADAYLGDDPPSAEQLDEVRFHAEQMLAGVDPPPVDVAVAVGGSAASLRRLVGDVLGHESLERALGALTDGPAVEVATRFALDPQRVRLMPAGLLALEATGRLLGQPLHFARGGLREGVLLDLAGM